MHVSIWSGLMDLKHPIRPLSNLKYEERYLLCCYRPGSVDLYRPNRVPPAYLIKPCESARSRVSEDESLDQGAVQNLPGRLQSHNYKANQEKKAFIKNQITTLKRTIAIAKPTEPPNQYLLIGPSTKVGTEDCIGKLAVQSSAQYPARSPHSVLYEDDEQFQAVLATMNRPMDALAEAPTEVPAINPSKPHASPPASRTSSLDLPDPPSNIAVITSAGGRAQVGDVSWDAFLAHYHFTPEELAEMR
jgi:hypothetical protein